MNAFCTNTTLDTCHIHNTAYPTKYAHASTVPCFAAVISSLHFESFRTGILIFFNIASLVLGQLYNYCKWNNPESYVQHRFVTNQNKSWQKRALCITFGFIIYIYIYMILMQAECLCPIVRFTSVIWTLITYVIQNIDRQWTKMLLGRFEKKPQFF